MDKNCEWMKTALVNYLVKNRFDMRHGAKNRH